MSRTYELSVTEAQLDVILDALKWYAEDCREGAKVLPDSDAVFCEAAANTAEGIRDLIGGL